MFQSKQQRAFDREVAKINQEVSILENILGLQPVNSDNLPDVVARRDQLKAQAASRLDLDRESQVNFTPVLFGDL